LDTLNVGTDTALGLAMAHTLIEEKLFDPAFAEKWLQELTRLKACRAAYSEWAQKLTSVPADKIRELARIYAAAEGALSRMAMG